MQIYKEIEKMSKTLTAKFLKLNQYKQGILIVKDKENVDKCKKIEKHLKKRYSGYLPVHNKADVSFITLSDTKFLELPQANTVIEFEPKFKTFTNAKGVKMVKLTTNKINPIETPDDLDLIEDIDF